MLNITEIFPSIQGETSLAGFPTTFVRLAACNLRCTWCDTPYSFGRGKPFSMDEIMGQIDLHGNRYVCVTGGEPLLQSDVHDLLSRLCEKNYIVSLETGGSLATSTIDPRVRVILDIKCPGSKMDHKNYWGNLKNLNLHDEIKFVLLDREDYVYAKEICQQHELFTQNRSILLSPVHGLLDPKLLVEWVLEDKIPVRVNLQLHKYVWTPETRGV
jgi:7-carboxy-7-deazaguanine synthase